MKFVILPTNGGCFLPFSFVVFVCCGATGVRAITSQAINVKAVAYRHWQSYAFTCWPNIIRGTKIAWNKQLGKRPVLRSLESLLSIDRYPIPSYSWVGIVPLHVSDRTSQSKVVHIHSGAACGLDQAIVCLVLEIGRAFSHQISWQPPQKSASPKKPRSQTRVKAAWLQVTWMQSFDCPSRKNTDRKPNGDAKTGSQLWLYQTSASYTTPQSSQITRNPSPVPCRPR